MKKIMRKWTTWKKVKVFMKETGTTKRDAEKRITDSQKRVSSLMKFI